MIGYGARIHDDAQEGIQKQDLNIFYMAEDRFLPI